MSTPDRMLDLTEAVYQAAENPDLWGPFVQKYAVATNFTAAAVVWNDSSSRQANTPAFFNAGITSCFTMSVHSSNMSGFTLRCRK